VLRSAQRADYNTGWADWDAGFQEKSGGIGGAIHSICGMPPDRDKTLSAPPNMQ